MTGAVRRRALLTRLVCRADIETEVSIREVDTPAIVCGPFHLCSHRVHHLQRATPRQHPKALINSLNKGVDLLGCVVRSTKNVRKMKVLHLAERVGRRLVHASPQRRASIELVDSPLLALDLKAMSTTSRVVVGLAHSHLVSILCLKTNPNIRPGFVLLSREKILSRVCCLSDKVQCCFPLRFPSSIHAGVY